MSNLARAMLEYAQAIRGDWNNFDGRSERDIIERWVSELDSPNKTSIEDWRNRMGLCADGNAHWAGFDWGHCREETCPTEWARYVKLQEELAARKKENQ